MIFKLARVIFNCLTRKLMKLSSLLVSIGVFVVVVVVIFLLYY